MIKLRIAFVGLLAMFAVALPPRIAVAQVSADEQTGQSRTLIVVTDLVGADHELSQFLTDTVVTDLSRSSYLLPMESATLREALSKLSIAPGQAMSASDVRRLGEATDAPRVLVGTFLVRDDQLLVNTRLLDSRTGLVIPGGAMSAIGSKRDLLGTSHSLSRRLHKLITGKELSIEDAISVATTPVVETSSKPVRRNEPAPVVDELLGLKSVGIVPQTARPAGALTEADLSALVGRISRLVPQQPGAVQTVAQLKGPVTRIRALSALVRLLVAPEDIENYRVAPPQKMPSDTSQSPAWGVPFLAAAVDQNWWPVDRPVAPRDPATWAFVSALITRMPIQASTSETKTTVEAAVLDTEPYTGLIIDARTFPVQRAMSPRITDESGAVVYPDPNHVPPDDYVMDHGMVSYCTDAADARRAGKHPLFVRAVKVSDIGHDDFVISSEAHALIREVDRKGKFLARWSVVILCRKEDMPPPATSPPASVGN